MDQRTSRVWEDMLDEFRALGGVADNICLKEGRYGRGLFPLDPAKPVKVHIPESLLIDVKHAEVDGDVFRVGAGARLGAREKAFLENYEREFSWGVGWRETAGLLQMMHDAPAEVHEILKDLPWLAGPTPEAIRERFFATRTIGYKGTSVIMPIVELANHGHVGRYRKVNGVGLGGLFPGEVLVRYRLCDPLQMFGQWLFASDSEFLALSLPLTLNSKSGSLVIGIDDVSLESGRAPFFPKVKADGDRLTLSYLVLGNKKFPRVPRGTFYKIMREAGMSGAEEAFDRIVHLNRLRLHSLIAASEGAAPPLGPLLRRVVRYQLEAMSHNFGAREL